MIMTAAVLISSPAAPFREALGQIVAMGARARGCAAPAPTGQRESGQSATAPVSTGGFTSGAVCASIPTTILRQLCYAWVSDVLRAD